MILQALKEYYDRKAADPESGIAPPGWGVKEIPFIIVIDKNSNLVSIEDTRDGEGKKKTAKRFVVPQAVKKTSGIAANILWDAAGYVLGVDLKKPNKQDEQKKAFIDKIKGLGDIDDLKPVIAFLEKDNSEALQRESHYKELIEENSTVSFRYSDDRELICHKPSVKKVIDNLARKKSHSSICLVTGEADEPEVLHQSIKGVYGAQSSGANIVSFNLQAFESLHKTQGLNAPVGKDAAFAYTTALNTLLSKDSQQKLSVGDATVVFWSAKKTQFESDFISIFKEPSKDNPDEGTQKIRSLLKSVETGAYMDSEDKNLFYILGLSPNAARISIRLWRCETVGKFAANIAQYFKDMAIIKHSKEPEYYSLWRVLVNVAAQDKSENIPPNIAGEMMASILDGAPFPVTVLHAALRRIKSDNEYRVKPVRAALIKAYINRYYRNEKKRNPNFNYKELEMSLDKNQPLPSYHLGRLFAALEKVQREGLGDTNTTIQERYYSAASTSPATVFPILMRLKNHHMRKFKEKGGLVGYYEDFFREIISHIGKFPAHLDIHEQGYFAIGYYHQMQSFYTAKNKTETKNETETK